MPLVPWHRLVICPHLLLLCGGLLLALFVVLPLLDPPFLVWAVLSLPSVWFLVCSLVPPSVVPPLLLLGFRFCCLLLCCEVAPLPRWLLSPSPPSVVPLRCPGPVFCAGPSLWVSGCFMRRPGCLALMPGVLWCFASSLHFASWQQRPLALCGVLCYPLHHGAFVVVELCAPALRYSSSDDPGPPLDTAKLHTRHSLLHV